MKDTELEKTLKDVDLSCYILAGLSSCGKIVMVRHGDFIQQLGVAEYIEAVIRSEAISGYNRASKTLKDKQG